MSRATEVKLAIMRALWQEVGPAPRVLTVDLGDDAIRIRAVFDGPISEIDRQSMSEVEAHVIGDVAESDAVSMQLIRIDAPARPYDVGGEVIYARRESAP